VTAVGFVSPHFDDAVLSCGGQVWALAGSTVITVFSGGPARVDPLPFWDQMSGFSPGEDVMGLRAQEDDAALDRLHARGQRLGFWDGHYRVGSSNRLVRVMQRRLGDRRLVPSVAEKLSIVLEKLGLETVFIPLGVGHSDHKITASACLATARRLPQLRWVVYEDLPYAAESSRSREVALRAVAAYGFTLEPLEVKLEPEVDVGPKRAAVECYRSQLNALGQRVELVLNATERYHRLLG
jgi:LmbE family N-acetylglucosaminyl deacetylase